MSQEGGGSEWPTATSGRLLCSCQFTWQDCCGDEAFSNFIAIHSRLASLARRSTLVTKDRCTLLWLAHRRVHQGHKPSRSYVVASNLHVCMRTTASGLACFLKPPLP